MKRACALMCALVLLIAGAAQAEEACIAAYRAALEELYYNYTFPDGLREEPFDVEANGFAVYDVDGDGRRELLVEWSDTIAAGWCTRIYDYDEASRGLREEYSGGINLQFYDNGMLEDPLSHNQGPSERFWPYFLAQYVADRDVYETRGSVEAMERAVMEERGEMYPGLKFPRDVDADGNGMVYSIDGGDWVDDDACERWRASFAGEGKLQRIPYVSLTLENIRDMK